MGALIVRMHHHRRGRRTRGTRVVLTPRDVDVLVLIGACGHVDTEQVARECFDGKLDRARRRLRQLYDARLLDVVLVASTQPNLLRLTKEGLAALHAHAPTLAEHVRLPGSLQLASVPHRRGIVDARCYVAALAAAAGASHFVWGNSGSALHDSFELREHALIPDAVFELSVSFTNIDTSSVAHNTAYTSNVVHNTTDSTYRYAVEVDCGTEPVQARSAHSIEVKLQKYAEAFADGRVREAWLLVTAEARVGRHEQIRHAVLREGLGSAVRLLAHDDARRRPVLPPPARVGTDAGRQV